MSSDHTDSVNTAGPVGRRQFVKAGAGALAATGLVGNVWGSTPASGRLKVGLVGCGGRGTGAAEQALNADPGVILWAMGDMYEDRLVDRREHLLKNSPAADRIMVPESRQFVG